MRYIGQCYIDTPLQYQRFIAIKYRRMSVIVSHIAISLNSSVAETNCGKNINAPHNWAICEGNPPVTGGFPSQRASYTESLSSSGCHHLMIHTGMRDEQLLHPLIYGIVLDEGIAHQYYENDGEEYAARSWPEQ